MRRNLVGHDRFGVLLGLLLAWFLVMPIINDSRWRGAAALLAGGMVLAVTLIACDTPRRVRLPLIGIAAAITVVGSTGSLTADSTSPAWVSGLTAVLLVALPVLVLHRILGHSVVTLGTVAGSLCAFILLGLAFGAIVQTLSALDADAYTQDMRDGASYFSFVTLTTLGYGDINPVSDLARSLATLEALLGQVLMVTLVARFVGTLGQDRSHLSDTIGPDAVASE